MGPLLLLAACGLVDRGDGDQADRAAAALLDQVAKASEAGPFRFELTLGVGRDGGSADEPVAAGASDGERLRIEIDGTALPTDLVGGLLSDRFGQFDLPDLGHVDRGLEAVVDGDDVYVRSPTFTALDSRRLASVLPAEVREVAGELGDGWGRVDRRAFADVLPGPLQTVDPARGLDGDAVRDLLVAAGGLDDLGRSDVDGEELRGLVADVSVADIAGFLRLEGVRLPGLGDLLDGPAGSLEVPVELWIDDSHRIRRVRLAIGPGEVADRGGSWDDMARRLLDDTHLAVVLELDDYGDEDIEVDTPDEAVDVSADVARTLVLVALGG